MIITRKVKLVYFALVASLLASVWLGTSHAKPVQIGDALKIVKVETSR